MGTVRVFLVDDHRLFRDGLAWLLASDKRFGVVGEASSGEEFLAATERMATERMATEMADAGSDNAPESPFDVVLMDIDMPGMGGIETSRRALARWPEMRIVALSMHGEREYARAMVEAGVKGFLLKDSDFGEVTAAIVRVAEGGSYFSQGVMAAFAQALQRGAEEADTEPLSEREAEVLPLICEGLSNHEIAARLFISKRTVDKHRASILAKTGCRNTASLVVYAVKHNLIEI